MSVNKAKPAVGWRKRQILDWQEGTVKFNCRMRVGQDSVTWYDSKGNVTMHIDSSNKVTTYPTLNQEKTDE